LTLVFDAWLRRRIDPLLDRAGRGLAARGANAHAISLFGLAIGLAAVPLLARGQYGWALAAIVLNRLIDGLDGAVARRSGLTPFGGYLDIVCDMAFYAAVPFGFALADPRNALWAALLLGSFVCTATSFLGRAIMAEQRAERDDGTRGRKSFFYARGLVEGGETILAFVLFCLLPGVFPWLAGGFAVLCLLTAAGRVLDAWRIARSQHVADAVVTSSKS
jgi:phosphatidylglycerophosphate synthase